MKKKDIDAWEVYRQLILGLPPIFVTPNWKPAEKRVIK